MKTKLLLIVLLVGVFLISALQVTAQEMIGTEITSITTVSSAGEMNALTELAGDSEFADGTYNVNFIGLTEAITALEFEGGNTQVADAIPASVSVRRPAEDDTRQVAWYLGNLVAADNTFVLASVGPMSVDDHMNNNNILAGADNVFTNAGATVGETPFTGNQGIERIDFILDSSVSAADRVGFAVFERGPGSHDGFGIAAITGVDESGMPNAYGPLYQIPGGEWGTTVLVHTPYFVLSNGPDGSGGVPSNPTLTGSPQQIGGILFRTSELVDAGTEVFGYSLVGPDVTCTSEELVDITATCYPSDTGNPGGIDFPGMNLGALTLNN